MRPAGVCHVALIRAAQEFKIERAAAGHGATLLELVHRSQVGYQVARALVPKLKERGHLEIVGSRRVDYCNKPVAEYAPVFDASQDVVVCMDDGGDGGIVRLGACLSDWGR